MGDCVRTPIVARMNDANPKPNSNNPEFIGNWLQANVADYEGVVKRWTEQEEREEKEDVEADDYKASGTVDDKEELKCK